MRADVLLRRMNRLSIEMTQQARRAGRKKGRKRVLRQMKKLVGIVRAHARRHRELLDQQWEQTEWTRPQVEQLLRRLDGVLELLPRAQKQAHERIIDGRPVETVVTGIRPGEKVHEILVSDEEAHRTVQRGKWYVILPMLPEVCGDRQGSGCLKKEYSSNDEVMDLEATRRLLMDRKLMLEDVASEEGELLR